MYHDNDHDVQHISYMHSNLPVHKYTSLLPLTSKRFFVFEASVQVLENSSSGDEHEIRLPLLSLFHTHKFDRLQMTRIRHMSPAAQVVFYA